MYKADTGAVQGDKAGALASLRDVIERRVNLFGVAEKLSFKQPIIGNQPTMPPTQFGS